ncbi:MAG TPA: ABC-F family ATP-binding cassette domain-containing protein [Fredinandcohnia sp.]|nr:ABC-F family ATP-binding cassette domain-containing protein [Fredinandcohnia sp.]
MSLVIAQDLHLSFGPKTLLAGANFSIGPRDRIGLVGANGTGKSTLMKILAGRLEPDGGALTFRRGARVGYLPQDLVTAPEGTLLSSVLAAVPGRESLEAQLAATEQALAAATSEPEQLEYAGALAELHAELEHFEEHYGRHRAERILEGLGFRASDFERPVAEFSGGWRMRAALAALLLQDPDLLLLDEPTNHLDVPSLVWFDAFLRKSRKALVLICHDREFLNRQIDRVLALEVEGLRSYTGNYDRYKEQRAEEAALLEARARNIEAKRAHLQSFVDRFRYKASKARQAQSRLKQLEKLETVQLLEERATMRLRFPEAPRSGREVVRAEGLSKAFGPNVVYENARFTVERGQRIAIIAPNGAGKTTLLKMIAGELAPDAGRIEFGHNVILGYYAQHHADTLDPQRTIFDYIRDLAPSKSDLEIRSILGALLFGEDEIQKRIGVLSGGERARVALARLLAIPANLLVMDEPTNHLDLDSSERLVEALREFEGTVIFVSHNRSFINGLATHVWEVKDRGVEAHIGNLDDWLARQPQAEEEAHPASRPAAHVGARPDDRPTETTRALSPKERRRLEAEERQRRSAVLRPIQEEIARIEARIEELETTVAELTEKLADPGLYEDFERARSIADAHREGKEELERLYARWEEAQERLAVAQASL